MINISIPAELITGNSFEINYSPLNGKTLLGLAGYARAGKDSIGRLMVERLGFKRISFGDMLKEDLNKFMKELVFDDLQNKGVDIEFKDVDFLSPSSIEIKEKLRPYMIWFGEQMKINNGKHYWTNRAFECIEEKDKKIIITDVRRPNELDIFRNSREFNNRKLNNRKEINMPKGPIDEDMYDLNFETLLFYVNQLFNTDTDVLTTETILTAMDEWLFDEIIYVDSRIPNTEDYQEKHILNHIRNLVKKYPTYLI